jgi:hypothetical protein
VSFCALCAALCNALLNGALLSFELGEGWH